MAHNHAKTLQRVEQELKLAGYSPRTVSSYLGAVNGNCACQAACIEMDA